MRVIPTKVHGILDYIVGVALIAAPWLFGFASNGPDTWVPVTLGIGTIIYSLLTDYELGAVGVIPMGTHLAIDIAAGLFLAISPWVLGYADVVWLPHVAVGVLEVIVAAMTQLRPVRSAAVPASSTSVGTPGV